MKIETKFNFADRVYVIYRGEEQYKEICEFCDGLGNITHKSEEVRCNKCYGNGYFSKYKPTGWYIPKDRYSFVIQKIATEYFNPGNKRVRDNRSWTYYMEDSSGTMWDENNLFISLEEAQVECDRRNKEEYEKGIQ